jgi:hypothetical protein
MPKLYAGSLLLVNDITGHQLSYITSQAAAGCVTQVISLATGRCHFQAYTLSLAASIASFSTSLYSYLNILLV